MEVVLFAEDPLLALINTFLWITITGLAASVACFVLTAIGLLLGAILKELYHQLFDW